MAVSAAIGGGSGGGVARVTTSSTWDAAYNVYKISTAGTDVDFVLSTETIKQNRWYAVFKVDSAAGHVIIQDEDTNEIERLYAEDDNLAFMYDGTDFLVSD